MKRLSFSLFSIIFSAIVFASIAQAQQIRPYETQPQEIDYQNRPFMTGEVMLSPFNLTTLAYRGYLSEQGIPGYINLLTALDTGRITADEIIEAAITAGRLPNIAADDLSYENAVELQLNVLSNSSAE